MAKLRIMTWNLLHAPGDRLQELADSVRALDPDILACQELNDEDGFHALSEAIQMPGVLGSANRPEVRIDDPGSAADKSPEHIALFSRHPIVFQGIHRGDPEIQFRPVLEAVVQVPELGDVRFFVVHFRAFPGPENEGYKVREARFLADLLTRTGGKKCALGDFNAWAPGEGDLSDSWGRQHPEDHRAAVRGGVIRELDRTGLVDAWRKFHPSVGTDPTQIDRRSEPGPQAAKEQSQATGHPPHPGRTLRDNPLSRVDYVWLSPSLADRAVRADAIRDARIETASDHYPVLAELQLP